MESNGPMTQKLLNVGSVVLICLPLLGVIIFAEGYDSGQVVPSQVKATVSRTEGSILDIVIAMLVILSVAQLLGSFMSRLRQPRIIGEMLAGILLGPSVMGILAPQFSASIFAPAVLPSLSALSNIGLVIFMFLVGLQFDPHELRGQGSTVLLVSNVGVAVSMFTGLLLAAYLYPRFSSPGAGFPTFAAFMGVTMSITAFPVLASILASRGMMRSPLGALSLSCAAINDFIGWIFLGAIVAWVRGSSAAYPAWFGIVGAIAFTGVMIVVIRPLLYRLFPSSSPVTDLYASIALLFALTAAATTEYLGIHLVFGAFLAGVILPHHAEFTHYLLRRFETLTQILLLPLFFAFAGLRMNMEMVQGSELWLSTALIVLVAFTGKFGSSAIAARFSGLTWQDALTVGALMNTRGLMELVALNIGLDIGVISPTLYSMMVLMTILTTVATGPSIDMLQSNRLSHSMAVAKAVP